MPELLEHTGLKQEIQDPWGAIHGNIPTYGMFPWGERGGRKNVIVS